MERREIWTDYKEGKKLQVKGELRSEKGKKEDGDVRL